MKVKPHHKGNSVKRLFADIDKHKILVFVISISLIAAVSMAFSAEKNPVDVYIKGNDIFYTGGVSADGYRLLREKMAEAIKKPVRLVINSGGGPVEDGLDIGNWLYDNGLDILVREKCMSSCANYIFPAAENKEISRGAVVAWHGSIADPTDNSDIEESLKFIDRKFPDLSIAEREKMKEQTRTSFAKYAQTQAARQKQFFQKIGVDERVTLLGPAYGAQDFYFLSVEDMKCFGIMNVQAPADYTKTDLTALRKKKMIVLVNLKEHSCKNQLSKSLVGAESPEKEAIFVSATGERLTASFNLQTDSVTLNLPDGTTARLPRAISGSGARYANANGRMIFWEHQGEVSVWIGDKLIFRGTSQSDIKQR